jgi:hypothetical protein
MTKQNFMDKYRALCASTYDWAQDAARLDRAMELVRVTLTTDRAPWNHNGECVTLAWRAIGGKGKPTRKALRALPDRA